MDQYDNALSRLQAKLEFQSDWDIVYLAVFFIFIGMLLLLFILVLIRCCCCFCCEDDKPPRRRFGIDNLAMERWE